MADFAARDVEKAFSVLRRQGIPEGFGPSTKWDIIDDVTDERFPPKVVLFLAKGFAKDESRSGGGGDIGTNNALRRRGYRVVLKSELEQSSEAYDIENIILSDKNDTSKIRLVNARLGQGGYRAELIELWEGRCAVTELDVEVVLRASHIKPWKDSTDQERLDAENGLLLAASIDALFDRNLISFDDDGKMLVCSSVKPTALEKIGVTSGRRVKLTERNRIYLRSHRAEFRKIRGKGYIF